jgi:hypothetical protein
MKKIVLSLILAFGACFALHAQTTYSIGVSGCGAASTTWIDCPSLPVTLGTTTTTMWLEADYPPNTAEDFFVGTLGDYAVSNVQIVSSETISWVSLGKAHTASFPTEITANLTGVDGTSSTGSIDLKIAYVIGKTGRYTYGPIASSSGGTVSLTSLVGADAVTICPTC